MFQPAFRHLQTREVIVSPGVHDIEVLPGGEDARIDDEVYDDLASKWEIGFVDTDGVFFSAQDMRSLGLPDESVALAIQDLLID